MNLNPQAILFDLDGVLIDSEGLYTEFWQKTEALYPTGIPDLAHAIKGTNLPSIMSHFKPHERADIMARIFEFDNNIEYPLFPGAERFLQLLQQRNIPAALVTSSNPEKMQQLFRQYPHFSSYFSAIVDGSMVSNGKPDPEGYLLAAQLLEKHPGQCVVIEDSLQGIRAGIAAGAQVWGLYTTLKPSLIEAETPFVFADISRILSLFIAD